MTDNRDGTGATPKPDNRTVTLDHPLVRASSKCPICPAPKDIGTVLCWRCYRQLDMRNGNPQAEYLLGVAELNLEKTP